ncbi:retrovirus-related pol polyprotein from transposon TNT 1-94 [Tanacetum coccineum]
MTTTVFTATTLENTPSAYRASTSANPNHMISPAFVEANYEDYDEEREIEPRPEPNREDTPPLQLRSHVVRRQRERIIGFEEALNREGSRGGINAEGTVNGQPLNFLFQTQIGNPLAGAISAYHSQGGSDGKNLDMDQSNEVATNGAPNDQRENFKRSRKSFWDNNKGQKGRDRHDTNDSSQLRNQIEEAIKSGQLSPLVKGIKKERVKASENQRVKGKKDKGTALTEAPILMIRKDESYMKNNALEGFTSEGREITFPSKGSNSLAPVIIKAKIFRREVSRVHMDSRSSCDVIYKHFFMKLRPSIRASKIDSKVPLIGFSREKSWSSGEIPLVGRWRIMTAFLRKEKGLQFIENCLFGLKNIEANLPQRLGEREEVLVKVLSKKSIEEKEILQFETKEGKSWMTPIYEYLVSGLLPEDPKESRKIKVKEPQYKLIRGSLTPPRNSQKETPFSLTYCFEAIIPISKNNVAKDDRGRIKKVDKRRESKEVALIEEAYYRNKLRSQDVITVGSTMRIPLLYRGEYSQWRERFMNYLEEQTDGEAMINSIQNGLSNDIYSLIDSNDTAKDLWDALERQMRGSEYGEQDRKAAILYEYETFKATEGEQLLDTYLRYLQVINDLKKCGYKKDNCELNYKFLNNLQPEWKQYGTLMRQTKNLMDINIDALYNILKQNQGDVNDAMGYKKKAIVVTSDPLALVAEKTKVSKRKEKVVVQSESEGSDDEDISDLKKITALLAKAFNRKKYYAKPTNNNLRTSSASSSANKKPEYVKSEEKKEDKKVDEKKRDMSKVKCYNCKKEGHFAKDCKKAKVKDYNYYKTKMLLAKKDSDEQLLLAEDQAWMESSSDSDQEINANMVFMAKMENVLSDSEESSSSAEETIAEVSYYTSDFESESEYETSEYYDNSTNYGLFVNNDDDQEIFHDAIESASENFNENHIVSQTDHDQSEVDHNDSEDKDHLVDKLIKKFNHKIAKCQKRIEKANQQSKDLENQNKDLQDKYDVLKNQVNTFEEKNNEFNEQIKVLNETAMYVCFSCSWLW